MSPVAAASRFLAACPANTRLLLAVSGGSDSLGLLHAFHQALAVLERPDIQLHAATIDHALRPGSDHEARDVAKTCEKLKIPHHVRVWSGDKPKTGVPAAARLARYHLLSAIAKDVSADCVLTGHTLNDQRETIAMRSARSGENAIGLSGMASAMLFDRLTWIARPFLDIERNKIQDFLIQNQIAWIDDPTNVNLAYERARIRNSLENKTLDLAPSHAAAKRLVQGDAVAAFLSQHVQVIAKIVAVIDWDAARKDEFALRAIAIMLAVMGGKSHVPGRDQLSKIADIVAGNSAVTLTVSRAVMTFRKGKIYIVRESRDIPSLHVPPGETVIWDGRFRVTNLKNTDLGIRTRYQPENDAFCPFAHLPANVANRARSNRLMAEVREGSGSPGGNWNQYVEIEPYFPIFDKFLPVFDLSVANSVSELFGRPAFEPFVLHYI